jgi:hypothetical protein
MNLKRFLYLGLLIVALIVTACSPKATPEPTATPVPTARPEPTATSLPLEGEVCTIGSPCGPDEVPMGFTEDGAPYRGNPNAPVTLVEHSEFQ